MNVKEMVKGLTTDEKIRLLAGDGDWHTYDCNGKIPAIMMTDGPHGLRKMEAEKMGDVNSGKPATCFPTASAIAASWNPEMAGLMARTIAGEAKQEKVSVVLGCGTNMKRSPFCGRNFEYFSEDPFLAGSLATEYIKSMQSMGVGTSLKHFAVNSQETRRMTSNSEVDERALREIYLTAFEMAVKNAKPTSVMCCYNRVNGDFGSHNRHLLTDILRKEWGFKGAVVSDWGATIDAVKCYKNGLTLEMPDPRGYHTKVLKKAFENGEITEEELNLWAENVIDNFSSLAEKVEDNVKVDYDEHNEIARQIENECAVLLKNEGVLPFSKEKTLIVVGDLAVDMRFQGGGSSHITAARMTNAVEALTEEGYKVVFARGYDNSSDEEIPGLVSEALRTIKDNYKKNETKILFFIGLTDRFEGEGYDREDLNLPKCQTSLLERITSIADLDDIAAVSFGGAPMDFSWEENVGAVLHMYLGGQAVGKSVADLVSGKVNPSGKLAETMPLVRTDTPAWRYFAPPYDDVEYRESIFIGYRYYETFNVPVRYPFGYGLSYTKFEYSDLKTEDGYEKGELKVSFKVKNTGAVAGKETVQLYINADTPKVIRSTMELKGFKKVYLEPGEEKTVEIILDERSFSIYDVSKSVFAIVGGKYTVCIGASVRDIRLKKDISVTGEDYFRDDREEFPEYFKTQPHGMEISKETFAKLYDRPLSHFKERRRGDFDSTCSFNDVATHSLFGRLVYGGILIALPIMFPGKKKDSPEMKMVRTGFSEGALEGLISNSGGAFSAKMVDVLVLAANRKHFKAFCRLFKG